jgi:tRNA threonylcarbamoyladenosine biosynthesis protein TsaB
VIVLGIESSTAQSSVALGSEQEIIGSCVLSRGATAEEFLLPAARFLMEKAGIGWENISGICVGVGPGLYTGMRVGVATAKTLAQALSVPIVATPSLDVLAFDVRYSNRVIVPALDAKRNEVFFSFYRQVPGGITRIADYQVGTLPKLIGELEGVGSEVLVTGNGALLYKSILEEVGHIEFGSMANAFPRASSLVELAIPRLFREDYDRLFEVEPMYMRKVNAQINWERSRAR